MGRGFFIMLSVFVCISLFSSCKVKTPKGILSESNMEKLLYDYHLAQSLAENGDSVEYRLPVYTESVLAKYKLSHDDFERSLKWYSRHADVLYKIYDRINQRLDNEAQIFGVSSNRLLADNYINAATSGDTANIWKGESTGLLLPKIGRNILSFRIMADSIFKPKDKFEWYFNSMFIYQKGKRNAVAVMAVRYENDSITSVQQQVYGNMKNSLVLSSVNLPIKQIEGFIYLEEPIDTPVKFLFLRDIALIRMREKSNKDSVSVSKPDSLVVDTEAEKKRFIDSIQNTAKESDSGDHFRPVTRERAKPHEKLLPR
mgnify:CR=1 FL=1